ncbi:MAG: Fe2+-dependent dioxygenase [Hyphomicrobium sp.]|nr:Fe2+-dependent dioxygenase [Hyphomicrobium sp.]
MLVHIPNVLAPATLANVVSLTEALDWGPGAATAGWHARDVKTNTQALAGPVLERVRATITEALEKNDIIRSMALPRRFFPPLISRAGPGEGYGTHVDDALIGGTLGLRSDISVTVFLSDPATYDGGELIVESLAGEEAAKAQAGDAVIYPSTTLHRVEAVTRGERLVAVTWIESRVRDAGCREILFDLDRARRTIFQREGKSPTFDLVTKSYSNLLRRWAE